MRLPPPDTVLECVPHLRLFAKVMCHSADVADRVVERSLQNAREDVPADEGSVFVWLLGKVARSIRADAIPLTESEVGLGIPQELSRLPPHHREVLLAVDIFHLRYVDAAIAFDCSIGTVKSRLNRARHAFTKSGDPDHRDLKVQSHSPTASASLAASTF